jgi:hypothetical protein
LKDSTKPIAATPSPGLSVLSKDQGYMVGNSMQNRQNSSMVVRTEVIEPEKPLQIVQQKYKMMKSYNFITGSINTYRIPS